MGELLPVSLKSRREFSRIGPPAARAGELFVPTESEVDAGERVTVDLRFDDGPRMLIAGEVTWRRVVETPRSPAGVGVVPLPVEQAKLAWLYDYVAGFPPGRRDKRRLPVRLRVVYAGASARRVNFTRDLNEDGAFVRARELPKVGDAMALRILPPSKAYDVFAVKATVTWVAKEGDRGFGVHFVTDEKQRRSVEDYVERLDEDYLAAKLPDEVLK